MVDPAYSRYDHPLAEELMVCSVCGACVAWGWLHGHTEWHKRMETRPKSAWEEKIG
jgi:hypothetical protein